MIADKTQTEKSRNLTVIIPALEPLEENSEDIFAQYYGSLK